MARKAKIEPVIEETVEVVTEETPVVEEKKEVKNGYVSGCTSLNVRKEPSLDSDIVVVLPVDASVVIEGTKKDFYSVSLSDGNVGYCLKKFIEV